MKRNSLFFILFLAFLSFASCSDEPEEEAVEETIYISTAEDIVAIKDEVNAGDNKALVTYILKNDIDLSSVCDADNSWKGIGTTTYTFNGIFDGSGHTISGLYVDDSAADDKGLFGYVGVGAEIKDLTVDGYLNGNSYIGAVAGSVFYATITNCHSKANVFGNSYIGGVVGKISYYGIIENCSNSGTVTGVKEYIGGIVGYNNYYSTVTDSYNEGSVVCGGSIYGTTYNDCVGGIAGMNHTSIVKNCENLATVDSGRKNTGGIVGENNGGTVVNCFNTEYLTCSEWYLGGIVGYNSEYGLVANCFNTGDVISSSRYSGGVVGSTDGKVTNCYNTGEVSGTNSYIGGIAGTSGTSAFAVLYKNYYLENTVMTNNSYADGGIEMTAEEMQSENFTATLNSTAYDYNIANSTLTQLCAWTIYNTGEYPSLDFEAEPSN